MPWHTIPLRPVPKRQAGNIRVKRNIEARSSNHCCRGKAKNITYSERVFVV